VAVITDSEGQPLRFVKASTEGFDQRLAVEARTLERVGAALPAGTRVPRLVSCDGHVLVTTVADWRLRPRQWRLEPEVAYAIGVLNRCGYGHGDFAPWNLVRDDEDWWILDWEAACENPTLGWDFWHYVVQAHALVGRPSLGEIRRGLSGAGWIGRGLAAYAEGVGAGVGDICEALSGYLGEAIPAADVNADDVRRNILARRLLRDALA
jgi:hypothetical protein